MLKISIPFLGTLRDVRLTEKFQAFNLNQGFP